MNLLNIAAILKRELQWQTITLSPSQAVFYSIPNTQYTGLPYRGRHLICTLDVADEGLLFIRFEEEILPIAEEVESLSDREITYLIEDHFVDYLSESVEQLNQEFQEEYGYNYPVPTFEPEVNQLRQWHSRIVEED